MMPKAAYEQVRASLTETIKKQESSINQLTSDKAKLENYTKKTLHAVQAKYMVAMAKHRDQIKHKDDQILGLKRKVREQDQTRKREEELLMSTFYEVGNELQRRMMATAAQQPEGWASRMRQSQSNARQGGHA